MATRISGIPTKALLDSGSQVSLMSQHFFEKHYGNNHELELCPLTVTNADGHSMTVKGLFKAEVKIGNMCCLTPFIVVSQCVNSIILGMNVITKFGLSFGPHQITSSCDTSYHAPAETARVLTLLTTREDYFVKQASSLLELRVSSIWMRINGALYRHCLGNLKI